jgi:hypothetical protein
LIAAEAEAALRHAGVPISPELTCRCTGRWRESIWVVGASKSVKDPVTDWFIVAAETCDYGSYKETSFASMMTSTQHSRQGQATDMIATTELLLQRNEIQQFLQF